MSMTNNQKQPSLPWDEIVDRLYHRQEPETIVDDLLKRKKITSEELPSTLGLITEMRSKIESFRLGS
jgi:hypothetical protein